MDTVKSVLTFCVLLACAVAPLSAAGHYGITDPFMAEYEGFWTSSTGVKGRVTAQVRPLGNNHYDGFILFSRAKSPVTALRLSTATADNGSLKFNATAVKEAGGDLLAENKASCEIRDGKITGKFSGELGEGTFEASKSGRKSPTLGAAAPKNAVILFDGKTPAGWQNFNWPLTDAGSFQVGSGNILAKDKLTNYRLHLEFRTPYMPAASGQERGNSGIYLQGKYEVQVLDSFGLYPLQDNDCGGIYRVQAPVANASLPPMEWQTYDITYVEASGATPPRISVALNGVTVVDRAAVPRDLIEKGTGGGTMDSGFLMLQDHGNPVQFRNIWAEPFFASEKKR